MGAEGHWGRKGRQLQHSTHNAQTGPGGRRNAPRNMNEKWPADLENAPVVRGFIEPRMWYWLFALSGA